MINNLVIPSRAKRSRGSPRRAVQVTSTGSLDFARDDGVLESNLMKRILLILSIVLCAFSAQAKLNVVATLPDFGSLARDIGGDNVSVTVLAKPTEDPHFVDGAPGF